MRDSSEVSLQMWKQQYHIGGMNVIQADCKVGRSSTAEHKSTGFSAPSSISSFEFEV